jgi:DNA-binding transcriptional ArsR family regulator
MSKPTLSEHLKHLKKKNLVIRKVEGVQSVTYLFNYLKFRDLERTVEEQPQPDEFELKEKQFNSLPLEEQIRHIVYSTIAINLTGLQLRILKALDPKADLMRNLMIMVNSRTHEVCEEWLIENCSKDGEYGRKAVQKLEVYIEKFEGKSPEDLKPEDIPDGAFIF